MIPPPHAEQPTGLAEHREPERPLTPIYCPRCKQRLFQAALVAGSVVEFRCHHSVKIDGRRETCGFVVRVTPSR
jgi:hypothetical protein